MTDAQQPPENEAEILHPERSAFIGDREVTMREFTWVESMRMELTAKPILDDLVEMGVRGDDLSPEAVASAVGQHPDAMHTLISTACDQPIEWVRKLDAAPGRLLWLLFWAVNASFFVSGLEVRIMMIRAKRRAAENADGRQNPTPQASAPSSRH